jgi:hypothetical protein
MTSRVWRRKSGPATRASGGGASTFAIATRIGTSSRWTPRSIPNWSGCGGGNPNAGARDIGHTLRPASRRPGCSSSPARWGIRSARRPVTVGGKPDEGDRQVRFDAGALETGRGDGLRPRHAATAAGNRASPDLRQPRQCSTLLVLGLTGTKREAVTMKHALAAFRRNELHLELRNEKTLVTHAREAHATFLGYELHVLHANSKHDHRRQRCMNGSIGLRVPRRVLQATRAKYLRRGTPTPLPQRTLDTA